MIRKRVALLAVAILALPILHKSNPAFAAWILTDALRDTGIHCEKTGFLPSDVPNNHDALYFRDRGKHYLIVSGEKIERLYSSDDLEKWVLVDPAYSVAGTYELDDGITVQGKHYIFEAGIIYRLEGSMEAGDWRAWGKAPADDVGVYFDGQTAHLFGEAGKYKYGYDGSRIAYWTSTDLQDWELVNNSAIAIEGLHGGPYGVGDPSLVKRDKWYLTTDIESPGVPYRVALWSADKLGDRFEYEGILAEADDAYRVQDAELVGDKMFANWMDTEKGPRRIALFDCK